MRMGTLFSSFSSSSPARFPDDLSGSALPDVVEAGDDQLAAPRFAFLTVTRYVTPTQVDSWLAHCYAVTDRVERISPTDALLALGLCTEGEAAAVVQGLVTRLTEVGVRARVGVGPSLTLAQLALLTAPSSTPLAAVGPRLAAEFLYRTPVTTLATLHPARFISAEEIRRLQRAGLDTLGKVARLGELALRRQFGEAVGRFLFAACRGADPRPLQPMPRPERFACRLRFAEPIAPDRASVELPRLARQVASELEYRLRQAGTLWLTVTWESGIIRTRRARLRRPIGDSALLATELTRLFWGCLSPPSPNNSSGEWGEHGGAIVAIRAAAGDLARVGHGQDTLWGSPDRRRAAIQELADALARRYGHPALLTPRLVQSDAIFERNRYRLTPLDDAVSASVSPPSPSEASDDPWRDVPRRLHWW